MTTTTARKTIARNHTRRIATVRAAIKRATVSTLDNGFSGVEVADPQAVITEWQGHAFSRLTEDVPGEKWTVHVHDNRWYTLYAAPAEQPAAPAAEVVERQPASDDDILEHVAGYLSIVACDTLTGALPADVDHVMYLDTPDADAADELLAAGLVELVDGRHMLTRLGQRLHAELVDPSWAAWTYADEQPAPAAAEVVEIAPAEPVNPHADGLARLPLTGRVPVNARGIPTITDPDLILVRFDDEKPDDFGRRQFMAYWLDNNVGPRCDEIGTRGQVFHSEIAKWLDRETRRGKTVADLETGAILAAPTPDPDPEPRQQPQLQHQAADISRPASDTDPAEIARTLTPTMCDVMSDIDAAGYVVGRRDTLRALGRRGLCGHPRYDFAEVTDLGRAVNAVLKQPSPMRQQPQQQTADEQPQQIIVRQPEEPPHVRVPCPACGETTDTARQQDGSLTFVCHRNPHRHPQWCNAGGKPVDVVTAPTPHEQYQLAYGYALAVLHLSGTQGVRYGIDTEADVQSFAAAYEAFYVANPYSTQEVSSAFGEWRTTGNIIDLDVA
ncbi:hypothetical protein [Actinophytocola sp.]|uniref:hypothetical protein n=1 Tax=Actinophytocola sp. TaxID=1872138 RepID=UPI002D40AA00|nr:hypothetical protein [Actinophytocola sp.]HYQ69051.1 hypothetical protein [Actinophytocola sp.]